MHNNEIVEKGVITIKKHKIEIKNICRLLCILAFISTLLMCFLISDSDSQNIKITNAPSRIVFNRWFNSNDVPLNINKIADKEITYHSTLPSKRPVNAKMIIKTNNLRLNVYTKGKLLTNKSKNNYEGLGKKYTIINLDDMGKNKEIFIHLTPLSKTNSAICDSIYITTQNEFLLELIQKSVFPSIIIVLLSILIVYFIIKGIKNIFKLKKYFYTSLLMMNLVFITYYNSTLVYLTNNNNTLIYTLKYFLTMIFPIILSCLIKEIFKIKSVVFSIFEISISAYCLIRLILFAVNLSPLDEYNYINFVILCVLILTAILHENQRSKKVKNSS